jgi:hypothetical protein
MLTIDGKIIFVTINQFYFKNKYFSEVQPIQLSAIEGNQLSAEDREKILEPIPNSFKDDKAKLKKS